MKNPSKRITWKEISRQKFLMVCAAIFFVYGIVFYYVPLAGWVMAFQNYKPKDGLFGSEFVGLEKFFFRSRFFVEFDKLRLSLCQINPHSEGTPRFLDD